jgi:1L-myo-inositol 1-phosphate cytidylyltransferase
MEALVLAAGYGSRLRDISPSKPLTAVQGRSLLEIAVLQLASVGVGRVVVATGHAADQVEAALPGIARKAGIAVEACRVDDHARPNGWSVMAGAAMLGERFLLQMADHLLSTDLLRQLVDFPDCGEAALLAVDRRLDSPLIDPADATWVQTAENGRITAIGKTIAAYDAVDCGAFRVTQELPRAIRAAVSTGLAGSLSEGMQQLADHGRAHTVDIGTAWWLDVDDAPALALAQLQVRRFLPQLFAPVSMAGGAT